MNQHTSSTRNTDLDVLKGIAITLVIWGHVMQYSVLQVSCFDNIVWKMIYMFHMPLFFLISGYLSQGAANRPFASLLRSRFWSLFLPLTIWSLVLWAIKLSIGYAEIDASSWLTITYSVVCGYLFEYWYIWVLLYSVFLTNLLHRISHGGWVLLAAMIVIWLAPDIRLPYLHYMKTMYPFFVIGYLAFQHKQRLMFTRSRYFLIAILAVFVLCALNYTQDNLMFIPERWLNVWDANANYIKIAYFYLFFLASGLSGSYLCYRLVRKMSKTSRAYVALSDVGRYTFCMYMLQGLWFFSFCRKYEYHVVYQSLAFLIAVVITYLVYRFSKYLASNPRTAFLAGYKKD